MEDRRQKLFQPIIETGWQIVTVATDEWWVREMWQLRSDETTLVVTFLVDPADIDQVWAVMATKEKPLDYAGEPPRYILPFERFDADVDEFIGFLSDLRKKIH